MVDFNAIRARNAEVLRAKAALETENKLRQEFNGPVKREKTNLEFVTELLDEHGLTEWEEEFCKSLKKWLKQGGEPSKKQKVKLDQLIIQYGLPVETTD